MERKPSTETVCGVEIPAEQRTPLVEALLGVIGQLLAANEQLQATVQQLQLRIEQLEDEILRLKGLPEQPKRKPSPSPLNDPSGPPSASGSTNMRKKCMYCGRSTPACACPWPTRRSSEWRSTSVAAVC